MHKECEWRLFQHSGQIIKSFKARWGHNLLVWTLSFMKSCLWWFTRSHSEITYYSNPWFYRSWFLEFDDIFNSIETQMAANVKIMVTVWIWFEYSFVRMSWQRDLLLVVLEKNAQTHSAVVKAVSASHGYTDVTSICFFWTCLSGVSSMTTLSLIHIPESRQLSRRLHKVYEADRHWGGNNY